MDIKAKLIERKQAFTHLFNQKNILSNQLQEATDESLRVEGEIRLLNELANEPPKDTTDKG